MKKCPKCGHGEFIITQHVAQTVIVDSNEMFVKEVTSCDEVTHRADDDDLWTCAECGYDAPGRKFNVKEGARK